MSDMDEQARCFERKEEIFSERLISILDKGDFQKKMRH